MGGDEGVEAKPEARGEAGFRKPTDAESLTKDILRWDRPEIRSSVPAKIQLVQWVQQLEFYLLPDQREFVRGQLGKILSVSAERLDRILLVRRVHELELALSFEPELQHIRLGDEAVYPTDGWLGTYLLHTQGSEVPLAWHFWTGVGVVSAALRRNWWLQMNQYQLWPNHYIVLVGPSGMGKGQSIGVGLQVLRKLNRILSEQQIPVDRQVHLIPEKITPERFIDVLKTSQTYEITPAGMVDRWTEAVAFIGAEELVTLLGRSAYHSDVMVHLLTKLWTCPDWFDCSTIGRGDNKLNNVAITMLMGSTIDWLRASVTEDLFGGGFMSRCVFAPRSDSGRRYPVPDILDPVTTEWLAEQLVQYATAPPTQFRVDASWAEVHEEIHHECRKERTEDMRMFGYWQRKPNYIQKLGMVLAFSDGQVVGTEKHIALALRILNREEDRLPELFDSLAASRGSESRSYILKTIVLHGGYMTYSELLRRVSKKVGRAKDVRDELETLVEEGRLRVERVAKQSPTYRIVEKD